MSVFLVLFDSEDCVRLQAALDDCGEKFRLSGSSCLLHSTRPADDILSLLKRIPGLVRPQSLFVIAVQRPHVRMGGEVHRWLRRVTDTAADGPRDRPAGDSTN